MTEPQELINIDNIDHFAQLIAAWHESKLVELEYLSNVPDVGVSMTSDEEDIIELSGDTHAGFVIGIKTAMVIMGNLPFGFSMEDVLVERKEGEEDFDAVYQH